MFNGRMEENSSLEKKSACGEEADARRVQPIGGYFPNMDEAWLAGTCKKGRILLRLGVFSALN